MKKRNWLTSWPRFLLWFHVLGVVGFYVVLWFRTNPNSRKSRPALKSASTFKSSQAGRSVSIIVPARNEEHNIRRCVTSLLEQNYNDYEAIVVYDASADGTARILDEIAHHHPQRQRLDVLR